MKTVMTEHYRGAMSGRTMYVIAFCMGPLDAAEPKFGVQVTDSEYVAVSMQIMTRSGAAVWDKLTAGNRIRQVPALGRRPALPGPGRRRLAVRSHQVHLPLPGRAHDLELRLRLRRQRPARQEVLLAAHRLEDGQGRGLAGRAHAHPQAHLPEKKTHYIAAAFPSSCGKTNLAMLEPTLDGWTAETVGDDIAWMRFGDDGRLYAVNPEAGFFGVAPGTGVHTNPHAMATIERGNSIFTNVALHRRRRRLVGRHDRHAAGPPDRLETPRLDPELG